MFGHGEPKREIRRGSHEGLIARATQLCKDLRSDPCKVLAKHSKGSRKRKRECVKEHQKNLVLIDYPGPNPCDITPLREYEKVFDGSIRFSSSMDEEEIREEIAKVLRDKTSVTHDLSGIEGNDFIFVKCSNRKVRVPDGNLPFDTKGICHTYPHGAVYVRLNKPMCKGKVLWHIFMCIHVVRSIQLLTFILMHFEVPVPFSLHKFKGGGCGDIRFFCWSTAGGEHP